jgi:hypothetical protein
MVLIATARRRDLQYHRAMPKILTSAARRTNVGTALVRFYSGGFARC